MNHVPRGRTRHTAAVAALTILLFVNGAWAGVVAAIPWWDPMEMIYFGVEWVNPANHAQGQFIQVETAGPGEVYAPAAQNLRQYGSLLNGGGRFQPGDVFAAPLDVLNGTSFGRSFGWTGDAPEGYLWQIVQTACSPGLQAYDPYDKGFAAVHTAPLLAITWDGEDLLNGVPVNSTTDGMFHPVYAVPAQTGSIFADYRIELVDAGSGQVVPGVEPGYVHLTFNAVPEPSSLLLLLVGAFRKRP